MDRLRLFRRRGAAGADRPHRLVGQHEAGGAELGGDARERGLAERAVRSAPESSVALDTYGWILVTEGDAEQGLKYLREAVSRDSNPLMRYHLAQALNELGRTSEAKLELDTILRAKQLPGWADDARKLRDSL